MSHKIQWVHVPFGASGSSTSSAKLRVPSGTPLHSSEGETSAPSQVCNRGISPPSANALEKIRNIQ
jgi:hypothetical protein